MAFDLEALVGHLYVVGGRSISTAPPGALVEVAPRKATRGREADTFFALVLPSGDVNAPTSFYERMAQTAADQYFKSGGSVTAGIRSVLNSLNVNLHEHNLTATKRYEANIVLAVLHGDDLYVGRVGAAIAALRHAGETHTFPEDLTQDEAVFLPPLGVQPVPEIRMTRYTVASGSRLILADSNVAEFDREKLSTALMAQNITDVLAALRDLTLIQTTLMAVEFVPPDEPLGLPIKEGESSAEIMAQTAIEHSPDSPEGRRERKRPGLPRPIGHLLGVVALVLARGMDFINRLFDHFFPQPGEGERSRWFSNPITTGTVLLVPVAVVVLVVSMWLLNTGQTDFELCYKEATGAADIARGIAFSDKQGTLAAWSAVLEIVNRCEVMRPTDTTLDNLRDEGQQVIDGLNQVTRHDVTPLTPIQSATLTRIELQGNNLFVLDDANNWVYHMQLDGSGRKLQSVPQPIAAMSSGTTVDGFPVGNIIDIAYDSDVEKTIAALDENGVLVRCPPNFLLQCDGEQLLQLGSGWVSPTHITFWQGKLYVLDPGASQIYRYEATGGTFASLPSEYFVGTARPNLENAVDFAIDTNGAVYILFADGTLSKYLGAEAEPFGFDSFPYDQPPASAVSMFLNTNPVSQNIFIVSRADRSIYKATFSGLWSGTFRATDENLFTLLSDVTVDTSQNLIYAVSGNTVLVMDGTQQ